jgi:hypothetical protein
VSRTTLLFNPLLECADDLPDDLSLVSEGGCYFLRAPFAESLDGHWWTVVDVGLRPISSECPIPGRAAIDFFEFAYEITLFDRYLGTVRSTMDRSIAREWLPAGRSQLVLEVVAVCCRSLIRTLRPDYIYRVTNTATLPEVAFKKHHFVTQKLQELGYSVLYDGTDPQSRRFWLMGAVGVDLPPLI